MNTDAEKQPNQNTDEELQALRSEQNLLAAVGAGFVTSIVMAILWATITVIIEYQIGYMAIAVGLAVGLAVRFMGKGIDIIFGINGAFFALLGCLLGDFFSLIGFAAIEEGLGYFEILFLVDYSLVIDIMIENTDPISMLFYAIAIYEGYKFSFRGDDSDEEISDEQI
jgi:hypothetical protein